MLLLARFVVPRPIGSNRLWTPFHYCHCRTGHSSRVRASVDHLLHRHKPHHRRFHDDRLCPNYIEIGCCSGDAGIQEQVVRMRTVEGVHRFTLAKSRARKRCKSSDLPEREASISNISLTSNNAFPPINISSLVDNACQIISRMHDREIIILVRTSASPSHHRRLASTNASANTSLSIAGGYKSEPCREHRLHAVQ